MRNFLIGAVLLWAIGSAAVPALKAWDLDSMSMGNKSAASQLAAID